MSKIWNMCLVVCLLGMLVASASADDDDAKRPVILCSTTQIADFARQIVGDRWEVRCVLAANEDPHMYALTQNDVASVKDATLCAENGLHLEGGDWMKTLAGDAGKSLVTCTLGIRPLELEEDGQIVNDPHAWFTPQNAAVYVRNLLNGLMQIDPDNAGEYQARAELYLAELRVLHSWIVKHVNSIPPEKRVLVTSHDAFNYFCTQYGFKSAAPAGWSTGQEVGGGLTPARRRAAVESIREFGVKSIFVETSVNPKVINEIAGEAGVSIGGKLYSDSMGPEDSAGESYLGMMRENVLKIVQALK